ncbi:ADP-ribosylglycohydrolase family protein [Desulfotomaculum nigrificans]|uniref:ADP-ribosylglycohydrolase family protein n=1 Tax=Desulfotomaculum nigrificans TaxID=1565 RepID=UPI001F477DC1|nr:ADP-ribosylglycohydrolase family protein [Desulfotomaculum nigrificans]
MIKLLLKERIIGGLLGVVVGDALGLPVQFLSRAEVRQQPVTGMTGYGTLPPGTWSDDSSLTLCLAESLCEVGYDPQDISCRFVRWYRDGYWTPFGRAFDIGRATSQAMERLIQGVPPLEAGPAGERHNGNGSLMRILPAALYFANAPVEEMLAKTCEVSRITHGHPRSQLACCIYALMVKELLAGKDPATAYEDMRRIKGQLQRSLLAPEIVSFERVLNGRLIGLPEDEIKSSGYVVDTLEAALWCLLNQNDFRHTLLAAVNLGEDTDTVGAVTGGLAGVYYGYREIPPEWLKPLVHRDEIEGLARRFYQCIPKLFE